MITQEFDLNMIPESEPVVVHVNQYDVGEGRFKISLYDKDQPYSVPAGAEVIIQGTKPDNHGFCYNDCTFSGNLVTANVTQQMTACAGITRTQLQITDSNGVTGTFAFLIDVQMSALQDGTDISDTELPAIVDAARASAVQARASELAAKESEDKAKASEDAAKASEDAAKASEDNAKDSEDAAKASEDNAKDSAEDSEAWAVGQRNGIDVQSSDVTYHNNSKYYAEGSAASAANAKADADRAAEYADYVIPSFIIANNRLYIKQKGSQFLTANNRLYVKIA